MRVTLLHHPQAGDGGHPPDELLAMLADAGFRVRYQSTDGPWEAALQWPADLVAVAGGDGTVASVIRAMAGSATPLVALPFGTANNICRTLGIAGVTRAQMEAWTLANATPFDVWRVTTNDGTTTRMVEGVGGGVMAELIPRGELVESAELLGRPTERALALLDRLVDRAQAAPWSIELDGRDLSGSYLGVEMMNIRFLGPNVPLAPDADPGDGHVDLVRIRPSDRPALRAYIRDRSVGTSIAPLVLDVVRGRSVRVTAPAGIRLHLDDDAWPQADPLTAPLVLEVEAAVATDMLRPASA